MKKLLIASILAGSLLGSVGWAQDIQVNHRRQPVYEVHTHDRYIKYERSGGFTGDGTIHFMNKTTIRRRYGERQDRRRGSWSRSRCTDEKGRSVRCR
jgi:hypothetical protein